MYKVLIADDEMLILNGLRNLIQWESLELYVQDVALNGEEALGKFIDCPVDIVITDIAMPKINGLELIKKIKDINANTKFIILSGYDDFNFARQAIGLGIENYIMKPINEEELEATLRTTIQKMKSNLKSEEKKLEIIRENILNRWISDSISAYELEERSNLLNIDLKYSCYMAAIISCYDKLTGELNSEFQVYNSIKAHIGNNCKSLIFRDLDNNIVCLWGGNNEEEAKESLTASLSIIINFIDKELNLNSFISMGSFAKGFNNVHHSYDEAKELQLYLMVKGFNQLVDNTVKISEKTSRRKKFSIDIEEFSKQVLNKDIEKTEKYIDNIFDSLQSINNITPEEIHNIAIKMLLALNKISKDLNILDESDEEKIKDFIFEVCNIRNIDKLKSIIKENCNNIIYSIGNYSNSQSPVIRQILSYINNNYHEEISIKTLGYKYNINPSYLGQIFNKEVGRPFSDYLNEMKNEKAKELLLTTNLKINDISKKVGYSDTSYFFRKFKEQYGISPNTFRKNKNYQL